MEAGLWEADGSDPYQAQVAGLGDNDLVRLGLKGPSFGGGWARRQEVFREREREHGFVLPSPHLLS